MTLSKWGRIDMLVNSAGHYPNSDIVETTDTQWHEGLETYFLNVVRAVRIIAPVMQAQKKGSIVNISTAWAFEPSSLFSPSSAVFRASLATYTRFFTDQYSVHNVRMNNVLPGWIDTLPATEERRASIPMGRYGYSEEVAATVAFLASESRLHHGAEHSCGWRSDARHLISKEYPG